MEGWLTVIIVVLIIAIVLDGLRRMRIAKRESLRVSKNAQKFDAESDFPVSSSEFPSGGARVAAKREVDEAQNLNQNVRKSFESARVTKGAPNRIPEQVSLNLDEAVPMLMDSVDEVDERNDDNAALDADSQAFGDERDHKEPTLGSFDDLEDDDVDAGDAYHSQSPAKAARSPIDSGAASTPKETKHAREERYSEPEPALSQPKPALSKEPAARKESAEKPRDRPKASSDEAEADYREPDVVLIMNVMAKPGRRFYGPDLLEALMDEKMKFGDMDIFHRYKDNDGDAPILYSLANMVVPGTFNLATMADFETPGVSIFLSLPVADESLAVYNDMAQTARNLANKLDGELKDENRSVMTSQTIEHGRQRVIEYERKRKLARV